MSTFFCRGCFWSFLLFLGSVVLAQDRSRSAAEKAAAEGEQLRLQGTADSKRQAIAKYEEALAFWQAVGDRRRAAETVNKIAEAHWSLNDFQKALDSYNQALSLWCAIGERRGEAATLNHLGELYAGNWYATFGEPQKALEYHQQALALFRDLDDRQGEATTLNLIGYVYALKLHERQRALEYHHQALALSRASGGRQEELSALNGIALVYYFLREHRKALEYYSQTLTLARAMGDHFKEAGALHSISGIYFSMGDYQKALESYGEVLVRYRALGKRGNEAVALRVIGLIHEKLSQPQKALHSYEQSLLIWRAKGDRTEEANTLHKIALFERNRGNLIEARRRIATALDIFESLRARLANHELRASYLAWARDYYEFDLDLRMRLHELYPDAGHEAAALQASEAVHARSLLETLAEARVDIRQGVDSVLVKRERDLQKQLNATAEGLARLLGSTHTTEDSAQAQNKLHNLLAQYQEVQTRIRATSPRYAALTQPQPLSLKEIQEQVLDEETMLLEYALGNERSFLWAVTSTTINSFVLPKRALIDSLAQRVYELLTARHQTPPGETQAQKMTRVASAEAELLKALSILSQIILGPALKFLENKRLLIVSDGALQYIPFAALPVPVINDQSSVISEQRPRITEYWSLNTAYWPLIADHEIVSLPSASVLAMLRHELANRELAGKTVAVFADPVFTANDPRLGQGNAAMTKKAEKDSASDKFVLADALTRAVQQIGLADSREGLRRLIFSRREAEGIMQLVPGGKGRLAVDFEANHETAISAGLSGYRILHFATHGLINSAHPELSGIVLSLVNEKGEEQDGFLRLHEIYNLNLSADLVVLSGCQTALGKEIKGEGLVGLTRGFMYAGAARVVASLWSVQDDATAELMKRFYQKMLGKAQMRPAAALRAAQVETWKTRRWQSPFYWASFILQGEWR